MVCIRNWSVRLFVLFFCDFIFAVIEKSCKGVYRNEIYSDWWKQNFSLFQFPPNCLLIVFIVWRCTEKAFVLALHFFLIAFENCLSIVGSVVYCSIFVMFIIFEMVALFMIAVLVLCEC